MMDKINENGKKVILIVDDSLVIRKTLKNFLGNRAYDVHTVENGKEFFKYIKTGRPHIIILDKMLPDGDGFDILNYIKMNIELNNIPVILFTTQDDYDNELAGLKLGAEMFLSKSVKMEELELCIRKILIKQDKLIKIKENVNRLSREIDEKDNTIMKESKRSNILNEQLNQMSYDLINVLLKTLEVRDPYTKKHSESVSQLSEVISQEMKLTPERVQNIKIAGYFHDIGKIGIPDNILNSTKMLSRDERITIEKHPIIGAEILETVNSLKHLAEMVKHHHENFDGSGYPDNLTGEKIPLESRIIRVADFFDALSTDRVYRPAYSYEQSLDMMKKRIGTFFDKKVFNIFLKLIEKSVK
ncbi:response regulator [bacterium]|nr:response regulator [bacterium]